MSFGGFGGFGSNNNNQQQQGSGFGFGSNTNNTGGFGSNNSGFGNNTNTAGGSLFGNTSGGFGSGGFGSNNTTSAFGQNKPAFGAPATTSAGTGLFGGGNATAPGGFGGFGSNTNQSSGFGSTSTGGGLFGANKPATTFGNTSNTGGLFGGGGAATTTGGFGAGTAGGFGSGTGFGGAQSAQCQGTDGIPFQPVNEKETGTGGQIQYQTITTMDQYKNWSFEELRVADYLKGKRYGNANGQAGAFGQSTGFGSGFGNNNNTNPTTGFGATSTAQSGGLFGSANQNSSFGQTNAAAGFGTGGGLFGANKPATGGLFGSAPATSAQTTGGLFGATTNNNTTTGAFGSGTTAFGSGGGLFGQNNQQANQPKPAFGGFGTGNTTNTNTPGFGAGTGFGQTNQTSGGGLFGQTSTAPSNPFGGATQTNTSNPFGGFGQANQTQQQNTQQQGGGLFGGGFGANNNNNQQQQAKPLFGATNSTPATGGLFGQNNNQPQQSGGLFGNNNAQQQTGGLFGAAKPATQTGGLFGGSQPAAGNSGGGLFGGLGSNNQQQQSGGLFGNNNNTQQQTGGLFGAKPAATSGGLFGQSTQQNAGLGGSLFGNNNNQQQQQQPQLGGSLFGNSLQAQQQPSNLFASLDANPYGNDQLFANMNTPSQSVGPIATPLSSSQKARRSAILPQHKLNPAASTRLITPQKRPPAGFGFSYSTYGTPGSAMSNASPASGFLGGSFSRSLGKSFSTSNLRGGYESADTVLAPGAFSATPRAGYAAGSLKRLTIDRNINTRGLFSNGDTNGAITSSPLKKTVSFDPSTTGANGTSKALVRVESPESSPHVNGKVNGLSNGVPDSSKGKELAVVPEGAPSTSKPGLPDMKDKPVGDYFMEPSLAELKKMSPQQLKKVSGFKVGRTNVGMIEYELPVDLSNIPLDQICGNVVEIGIRNASTYGENCTAAQKPPVGKGLNVRSIITLENSWPRSKAGQLPVHEKKGPRFEKHIRRLKSVKNTEFLNYDGETGTWKFRVEHYTTYGLDYDGEPEHDTSLDTSVLSTVQDIPTPKTTTPGGHVVTPDDLTMMSTSSSGLDDTFQFQKKRKHFPGGFEDEAISEDEQGMSQEQDHTLNSTQQSFLGERSVGSISEDGNAVEDDVFEDDESDSVEDQDMAGSFPAPSRTTEPLFAKKPAFDASVQPKSILKASVARRSLVDTSSNGTLDLHGDWAEQLQRTVSPKKRDRFALRESQGNVLRPQDGETQQFLKSTVKEKPITNSIDLMQSIWGAPTDSTRAGKDKQTRKGNELQFPYSKRPKIHDELWTEMDTAFHQCCKPRWSSDGTLVFVAPGGSASSGSGCLRDVRRPIVSEHLDTHFAKLVTPSNVMSETLKWQRMLTGILSDGEGHPHATMLRNFRFSDFAHHISLETPAAVHEHRVWQLASILFDPITEVPDDVPTPFSKEHEVRYRKDRLSDFWQTLVRADADEQAKHDKSVEVKAITYISGHNIEDACEALVDGKDYKLATIVSRIGGPDWAREDLSKQIDAWRHDSTLAEINEPIRALYELASGNCAVCEGTHAIGSEDRATTFKIASRFGLDWRRAFGLRLWYGILPEEDIDMAVAQYESDISEGREDVKPLPWFQKQNVDMGWTDPTPENREDILWGLLKLYAAQNKDVAVNVADIFAPASVSGNPIDARLSWQLIQLFKARGDVELPIQRVYGDDTLNVSTSSNVEHETDDKALDTMTDDLSLTYAATLETTENWTTAIWLYTHLSSPTLRADHIKRLLSLHASSFSVPESPGSSPALLSDSSPSTYNTLVSDLKIPATWLHLAKALYARSILQSPTLVLHHLLAARDFPAAHHILCTEVAPMAIIARDHDTLREVLGGFEVSGGSGNKKRGKDLVLSSGSKSASSQQREWKLGGAIYFDFVHLLDLRHSHSKAGVEERRAVLKRLVTTLSTLGKRTLGSLTERAAVQEMARLVAEWLDEEVSVSHKGPEGIGRREILGLPIGESGCVSSVVGLAEGYFRGVLAYGR